MAFNLEKLFGLFKYLVFSTSKILVIKNPLNTKKISTPMAPNPYLLAIPPGNQWVRITNITATALIPSNCLM